MTDDEIEEDRKEGRTIKNQLSSFGFFDTKYVVAEAMKVLGVVNRHSRGVLRVQKELKANENGEALFDFRYQTAVMVTEMKSPRGELALQEAIAQGYVTEDWKKHTEKKSDLTIFEEENGQKPSKNRQK
jgi:ATP-dependent DNA helicase RecG